MTVSKTTMALADLQKRWVGQLVFGTTDHQLGADADARRKTVSEVRYSAEFEKYVAWITDRTGGEHVAANTPEALDRRLHQLAGRR